MERTNGQKTSNQIVMKIIDWYILKRYLGTFSVMILLFIPIGIIIDVTEKINRILDNNAQLDEVIVYYLNFTVYFANMLFPIFLCISIIWFTSKLANNSEIIAILSSGISFFRFLRPYFIGATLISIFALLMGFFVVPKSSLGYNEFRYKYMKRKEIRETYNVYRQINENDFIYVSNFNLPNQTGYNFSYESFDGNHLKYKIKASRITYNPESQDYTLSNYEKRIVGENNDIIEKENKKNMHFDFDLEDLTPTIYAAETMTLGELNRFIEREKMRGSSNIDTYLV